MKNVHGGDIYSYENVKDLSANINPKGIPDSVMNSMMESLKTLSNYPDYACRELRKKLSDKLKVDLDMLICGNGAADILFTLIAAVQPKKALLIAPGFAEYEESLQLGKTSKVFYDLKESKNFHLDEEYLSYLTEDIDIAFICSPNNPTGITVDNKLLLKIADKCKKNNIFLVLDECFNDFLEEADQKSFIQEIRKYSNIFILKSFTKMFAIAGARLGYGICSDKNLIEKMYKYRQPWTVSTIAQAAGVAALDEDTFVKQTVEQIKEERKYLFSEFDRLHIRYWKSEANFILFEADENLKEELLKYNILIRDCSNYRNLRKGFFRVAVKSHEDSVEFIQCLENIFKQKNIRIKELQHGKFQIGEQDVKSVCV